MHFFFFSNNTCVWHLICIGGNDVSVYLHIEWESECRPPERATWRWVSLPGGNALVSTCDAIAPDGFKTPMWEQVYGVQLYNVSSANWTEPGFFSRFSKAWCEKPPSGRKRNKCIFYFPFREIHLVCHPALRRVTTPSLLIRVPLREITRAITLTSGWENLKIGSVQFPFVLHMEKRSWMRKHTQKSEKGVRHYQWGNKI